MTPDSDSQRIIAKAVAVLPQIAAALDPQEQPAGGSWVALTVHASPDAPGSRGAILHRLYFTWRHEAPLEPLEESRYLELTRDEQTGIIKVPVWTFDLTPLGRDEWRLGYWFAAPLRMWMGDRAGDRVKEQGYTCLAQYADDRWTLEFEDVGAGWSDDGTLEFEDSGAGRPEDERRDDSGDATETGATETGASDDSAEQELPSARPSSGGRGDYYDFRESRVTCPECGWSGTGRGTSPGEAFEELFEYDCPSCGVRLGICMYPTLAESRAAWEHLSARERRELEEIEFVREHGEEYELQGEWQLPDLDDDPIVVHWDYDERGEMSGFGSTVLRVGDRELWREPVVCEDLDRFRSIVAILSRKYGDRLIDVVVGGGAYFLYGEDDSIPAAVKVARAGLRAAAEASGRGGAGEADEVAASRDLSGHQETASAAVSRRDTLEKKILYIDMESALADIASGWARLPDEVVRDCRPYSSLVPGFFALVEPLPGAVEAFFELSRIFDAYVLISGPNDNAALADEVLWMERFFGYGGYARLVTKGQMFDRADYLIEGPRPPYYRQIQGKHVVFGSEEYPDWASVLRYLRPRRRPLTAPRGWSPHPNSTMTPEREDRIHHHRPHPHILGGVVVDELPDGSLVVPLLEEYRDEETGRTNTRLAVERTGSSYISEPHGIPRPSRRKIVGGSGAWRQFLDGKGPAPLYNREDDMDDDCWPLFGRTAG